ncbi:MAG TPA: calcium-binding protein [Gemmobacter sp.]|nr:calcium-binding protein [Gemmobacter sp.]
MTTHTITGIQVTFSGSTATAVTSSQLRLTTTDSFSFRYALTAQAVSGFSPITITPTYGTALHAAHIGGTRVALNTAGRIAEYQWGTDKATLILMVETGVPNVRHYFVLDGDPLPSFANAAAYNSFIAGLTRLTSDVDFMEVALQPGLRMVPSTFSSYLTGVENDTVIGGAGDNWSVNTLYTGIGDDSITGLVGNDKIDSGAGNDTINSLEGADSVLGQAGNDVINTSTGNDTVYGGDGNDTISGGDGIDKLYGGNGNDTINGNNDNDSLYGDFGDDLLNGGSGDDKLYGGYANDSLQGSSGNDSIWGGYDNDTLHGESGNDVLRGERGSDSLTGGNGNDLLDGGYSDDTLSGGGDSDTLLGNIGNDLLNGDSGNDSIKGGDGIDTLIGGTGDDTLVGGSGADVFEFGLSSGHDRITDFRDNQDELSISVHTGLDSVADVMAVATQVGRNVVIALSPNDSITITNMTLLKLQNDIEFI